jgi:hypothetical protein
MSETDDTDIAAALREAGHEVERVRAHGSSDTDLARAAIATFLRHLPPAVFEDIALTGGPINHALALAVEQVGEQP